MFLSLIFSFQNHREYYKNCTTRQPGGLYAPLSVSRYRSAPIFMPYFRHRRNLVRFPAWTFWQATAGTTWIPHRSAVGHERVFLGRGMTSTPLHVQYAQASAS